MELILVLFFGFFMYVILSIGKTSSDIDKSGKEFLVGHTLDDYRNQHPECFSNEKFKGCHKCGEKSVWMKQVGNTKYGIHNQHLCRHCGEKLWRSNL
jgi:hypothetical protein